VLSGNSSEVRDEKMGLAQQLELPYVETSAKTAAGLDDLF
jgi:hypothetical protein